MPRPRLRGAAVRGCRHTTYLYTWACWAASKNCKLEVVRQSCRPRCCTPRNDRTSLQSGLPMSTSKKCIGSNHLKQRIDTAIPWKPRESALRALASTASLQLLHGTGPGSFQLENGGAGQSSSGFPRLRLLLHDYLYPIVLV